MRHLKLTIDAEINDDYTLITLRTVKFNIHNQNVNVDFEKTVKLTHEGLGVDAAEKIHNDEFFGLFVKELADSPDEMPLEDYH